MSNISIIGLGTMARALAARALATGGSVQLIGRDVRKTAALAAELGGDVTAAAFGETPVGDLVVLAVPYESAASIVREYGDALAGRVVVDLTNPFDRTTLTDIIAPRDSSGAEQIAAAAAPGAHVVKAFNTLFSNVLAAGQIGGQPVDVFIAGDDGDAKKAVAAFVENLGLRPLDVGDLKMAHWLEGAGLLSLSLARSSGDFGLSLKVIG